MDQILRNIEGILYKKLSYLKLRHQHFVALAAVKILIDRGHLATVWKCHYLVRVVALRIKRQRFGVKIHTVITCGREQFSSLKFLAMAKIQHSVFAVIQAENSTCAKIGTANAVIIFRDPLGHSVYPFYVVFSKQIEIVKKELLFHFDLAFYAIKNA